MTRPRVAMLGAGNRARDHLQTISRLGAVCELVGVCDASPERASAAANEFNAPAFTNLDRMLTDARPELLYVVVQPDGHRAAVEVAARRGVHVVSETPIALTLPQADAMIASARHHGVRLEVAENVWRWPNERLKHQIVRAGLIGEITQVHLWYVSGSYHGISTTRKLVGQRPTRARGFGRETTVPPHVDYRGEQSASDPYELGLIDFEGGAICVYQFPLRHHRSSGWDVIGTEGAIVGSDLIVGEGAQKRVFPIQQSVRQTDAGAVLERVFVETDPPVVWENPLGNLPVGASADDVARADICVGMCRAIREGTDPPYGGANARADQEILIAIRESARQDGAWVSLPLANLTEVERRLHDDYRRRYGHDPLGPPDEAINSIFPRISPAQMARGVPTD